jgi:hypothetical protein
MRRSRKLGAAVAALTLATGAHGALFEVQSMTIDTAAFHVVTGGSQGDGTSFAFFSTNLVAGAQNPVLSFSLVDPLNPVNLGTVTTYTTATSPAWVETGTTPDQFIIRLPTFTMDWDTVPPPAGSLELCRDTKPCVVPQGPQNADGSAVGTWDPGTQRYSVSWTYQWAPGQHPFPTGTTTWTLGGVATPIPEASTWALMAAGLGMLALIASRRIG